MMKHVIGLFLLLVMAACGGEESGNGENKTETVKILATTGLLGDVVNNIVGSVKEIEVEFLMGPGVDTHLYKATHGDLEKVSNADVIVHNGLHLEGKMAEVLKKMEKSKIVIEGAKGIDESKLISVSPTEKDPHVWFDVSIWIAVTNHIATELGKAYPQFKDNFEVNTASFVAELEALDAKVKEKIAALPEEKRVLITSHDAFGYFGKAYGIEVIGLQGISTVAEFGVGSVTDMVNLIVERDIPSVFVESSVSEKSLQAVVAGCKDKGRDVSIGGTLYSDALGAADTPEGKYIGMIEYNIKTICAALSK